MRTNVMAWSGMAVATLLWVGTNPAKPTSSGRLVPSEGRRECPHDWNAFFYADTNVKKDTLALGLPALHLHVSDPGGGLDGVGPIQNVPEFHDCQRFVAPTQTDRPIDATSKALTSQVLKFGALYAIFADSDLARLDRIALEDTTPGGPGDASGAAPSAVIVAGALYPPLGIRRGFNCLYLFRRNHAWNAKMVPSRLDGGLTQENCSLSITDIVTRPGTFLEVKPDTPGGFGVGDYPPVARWDTDPARVEQYIGIRCGGTWCEVGRRGFTPSEPFSTRVTNYSTLPHDVQRGFRIKGWYDEQILAVPGAPTPTPSHILGTYLPVRDLGRKDTTVFKLSWVEVAAAVLFAPPGDPTAPKYMEKLNFKSVGTWTLTPASFNRVTLCDPSLASCASAKACTIGKWRAQITPASGAVKAFCVKRWGMTPGIHVPGTARWRWAESDDVIWERCAEGCCELDT